MDKIIFKVPLPDFTPRDDGIHWSEKELLVMNTQRRELPLLLGSLSGPALKIYERRLRGDVQIPRGLF